MTQSFIITQLPSSLIESPLFSDSLYGSYDDEGERLRRDIEDAYTMVSRDTILSRNLEIISAPSMLKDRHMEHSDPFVRLMATARVSAYPCESLNWLLRLNHTIATLRFLSTNRAFTFLTELTTTGAYIVPSTAFEPTVRTHSGKMADEVYCGYPREDRPKTSNRLEWIRHRIHSQIRDDL